MTQPGDPMRISAIDQDRMLRAADWVESVRSSTSTDLTRLSRPTGIVQVLNDSGGDLDRFDVLGIDDVFPTPTLNLDTFKADAILHGITPTIATHSGLYVVLQEPAADGAIVPAVVSGMTVVKLEVPSGISTPQYADCRDSDADGLLVETSGSARVLYHSIGWGIVLLGTHYREREFEMKDVLAPGQARTAYVRNLEAGGYVTDTDEEFEVEDLNSIYRGRARGGGGTPVGSLGRARLVDGTWEIIRLQPHALLIQCAVDDVTGVESGDPNITVDTVVVLQPEGAILLATPPTVTNLLSATADDGAIVLAHWNQSTGAWNGVPACPA